MSLRVSSPDFGANSIPMPTPTPSPSKKLESPFLSTFPPCSSRQLEPFSSILPMRILIMEERKVRRLDSGALWTYAVKVFAGRAHSTGEMREKLRRRADRAADVEEVVSRLQEVGY